MRRLLVVLATVVVVLGAFAVVNRRSSGGCPGELAPPSWQQATDGELPSLEVEHVLSVDNPTSLAVRPGDDQLYVTSQAGLLVAAARDGSSRTVLDLTTLVATENEQGLLGLAFSPEQGDRLYLDYTDRDDDTHVVELDWADGAPSMSSARNVLFVEQPANVHNGGQLAFGPDGLLYISLGDGGADGGESQDLGSLLGSILRIDPAPAGGRPYRVPADNPFAGRDGARGEIFQYGLRNPWRFSFDRQTGDLWIADVGQQCREEINRVEAGVAGRNFGWPHAEGRHRGEGDPPADHVLPLYDYGHDDTGGCSIAGGYVYRGTAIPELTGAYVFADSCLGRLQALTIEEDVVRVHDLGVNVPFVVSFGEDHDGELYALSHGEDAVFRLVAR